MYRIVHGEHIEIPIIREAIHLTELPAPSTLCKAFDRLDIAVRRVLLSLSVSLLPTNGVAEIDASGFNQNHASKPYTKRTKLSIRQLQVTVLVDTREKAIIDLHVTTTRKHVSQIAPSSIKRNPENIKTLFGDKGHDNQKIQRLARQHEVWPLIKHREFTPLHKAWNARLDANLYG